MTLVTLPPIFPVHARARIRHIWKHASHVSHWSTPFPGSFPWTVAIWPHPEFAALAASCFAGMSVAWPKRLQVGNLIVNSRGFVPGFVPRRGPQRRKCENSCLAGAE